MISERGVAVEEQGDGEKKVYDVWWDGREMKPQTEQNTHLQIGRAALCLPLTSPYRTLSMFGCKLIPQPFQLFVAHQRSTRSEWDTEMFAHWKLLLVYSSRSSFAIHFAQLPILLLCERVSSTQSVDVVRSKGINDSWIGLMMMTMMTMMMLLMLDLCAHLCNRMFAG